MSDSDQRALMVGQIVLQYTSSKAERELLSEKLSRCGVELKKLGDSLGSKHFKSVKIELDPSCVAEFRLDQIRVLLERYYAEVAKAEDLKSRLHQMQVVID